MNASVKTFSVIRFFLLSAGIIWFLHSFSQDTVETQADKGYVFKDLIRLEATPVKNQYRSGTCWSFGTVSLIESELLRMGKGEFDLSEMFIVRNSYAEKADRYVRRHGTANFGAGGALPDAFMVMAKYGLVTEEVYSGKVIGEENHVHGELDEVLKAYVDVIIENPNKKLTPVWKDALNNLLDAYLGVVPEDFKINRKTYTPQSFVENLGLKSEEYVQITSFTHHPFNTSFTLEIPDNWNHEKAWNLPLDEMIQVIDHALSKGYSVAWASDVSEKGFSHRKGIAIIPETDPAEMAGMERSRWEQMTQKEKDDLLYSFEKPVKEKRITQEERQKAFDNYSTTDDHAMHILGTALDQTGSKYYIVKNSWGTDNSPYDGYIYVSESYVRYKTISIMLHRDGIPDNIKNVITKP